MKLLAAAALLAALVPAAPHGQSASTGPSTSKGPERRADDCAHPLRPPRRATGQTAMPGTAWT
ncbi:hypothetical protein ACFQY7_33845 [Actinomadura luteofluorescens]|uniref:hypothetical protein n=1 Tax=Actinomadura luteofluorescens TaxID=46163 RepID=UPI00363DF7FB